MTIFNFSSYGFFFCDNLIVENVDLNAVNFRWKYQICQLNDNTLGSKPYDLMFIKF